MCRAILSSAAIPSDWTPRSSYNSGQIDSIGGRFINAFSYFTGDLDDVRIYDRTLSQDEIKAIIDFAGNP